MASLICLAVLALVSLPTGAANAQTPYPPLVPEGEVFEDIETLLADVSRQPDPQVIVDWSPFARCPVAFSPDGKTLASASFDLTVRLWDTATGSLIRLLEGHGAGVQSVAFSPDGETLASATEAGIVSLWDVSTGMHTRFLEGHSAKVQSVAFSPDGKTLASASYDRTVRLWDVATGKLVQILKGHGAGVQSVAFSPSGKILASASEDRTVRLWHATTGKLMRALDGHRYAVRSVAFSPGGKILASASHENTVRLWSVATGKLIQTLEGIDSVLSVAFSPDGKTLATGFDLPTVGLWDVATGTLARILKGGGRSGVQSVAFSPDGKTLASTPSSRTVRLWSVGTGQLIRRLDGHGSWVRYVAISPDGKTLVSASDRMLRLWDLDKGKPIRTLDIEGRVSRAKAVAFSPDGTTLAAPLDRSTLHLLDVSTGEQLQILKGNSSLRASAFSFDGKTLASANSANAIRLWDVATGKLKQTLEGEDVDVLSMAFSPSGKILASTSHDRTVRLWDVTTAEPAQTLQGHSSAVYSVAFSPDGKTLASASSDCTVRLWNASTGEFTRALEGHSSWVLSVAFSPDSKTLASASDDRTVRLWDVATGLPMRTLQGHSSAVQTVNFDPSGENLVAGSTEIRLYAIERGFSTTAILIGGQRGTWIGCRLGSRCFRRDDGTLLLQRRKDGSFEPVFPKVKRHTPQLEINDIPKAIEIVDGDVVDVTLAVRNEGSHRAFWIGIRRVYETDGDPLVIGLPWNIPFLDPGDQADLQVRVSAHTNHEKPTPVESSLSLEVTNLYGEPISVPGIAIRSRVPSLEWSKAQWEMSNGNRNLSVALTHTGNLSLPNAQLTARLSGTDTQLPSIDWRSEIAPGATISVPFGLPAGAVITKDTRVTVTVRALGPPAHAWTFTDRPIRPASPTWILPATVATALVALAALGLFQHPIVRRFNARPSSLLRRPPPELPKARALLQLTGRLGSVLHEAGVERGVLDRAIDFWATDRGARALRLAERLGVDLEAATADLHVLPLGPAFPLNLELCLLHQPPAGRPASEVLAWLKARPETRKQVTLVVAAEPVVQDALHRLASADLTNLLVVPSGAEMTEILLSPTPDRALARIVASQVRRTHVSPYQTGGGVSREAIFFGRDEVLAHILNREPASYLVVGGRQLGKTSLLNAIRRRLADDSRVDVRFLALSGSDLTAALARSLGLPRTSGLDSVLKILTESDRRTLFLIDEADVLVRLQHRRLGEGEDDVFGRLRSLSEEGRCHFILTGFWNLYQAAVLDYASPLRNFGEILRLEALEADACVRLATGPMASMGLTYEEGAVTHLIERTGRRANLIAIACNEIVKDLDPTVRVIGRRHVDAALAGKAVQDALEGWQRLAGEDQSRLDRAVVYATVERESFTLAEVITTLREHGADVDVDRLERSLRRLELAWIVGEAEGAYTYRVPLFVERLRRQDPSLRLREEARKLG